MSEREPHSKSGTWDCTLRYVRCAQAALSILTLHDQKLVALLHLQLPPEIRLSSAKASLLRVTFVLDFGVPQISIEIDGIQVQASLVEDAENAAKVAGEPGFQHVHKPELIYMHPPCSGEEWERKGSGEEDGETDDLVHGS